MVEWLNTTFLPCQHVESAACNPAGPERGLASLVAAGWTQAGGPRRETLSEDSVR